VKRLNAESLELCRDRHGRVEGLLLLHNHEVTGVTTSLAIEQLQLRATTLRNVAQKYDGIPVKSDEGTEIWAMGDRGARFTVTLPSVEVLILRGNSFTAAKFMNALTESEAKLGAWLTEHLEKSAREKSTTGGYLEPAANDVLM